ncbi:MAG: acetate--CoA ligase family protein [Phycisphaerae bacterium]|nr:acetate--CoA ligase family protein [Phycisphaerae bacterium]
MSRLHPFMRPSSIAVVGASRKEGSIGKTFMDSLTSNGFTGTIHPVNPNAEAINGIACYQSIDQLPEAIELAVILLPYKIVPVAIERLASRKIKNVVVVSAGFKEVGPEGVQREKELLALAKKHDMRILGPNCMGLFNFDPLYRMNASFSPIQPIPGHVSFISQSGALGVVALDLSQRHELGFSAFLSLGNKSDIDEVDALEFLADDDNSRVILIYLESISRPEEFRKVCREVVKKKPILVVKAGQGKTGSQAASSHTGALASPDIIVDAFLKQCGVIRCETLEELLDTGLGLSMLTHKRCSKVAVLSNAGGPCILTADALEKDGLTLPPLAEQTQNALRKILLAEAAVLNPVDMISSADHEVYRQAFAIIERDPNIDTIVAIMVKPPVNSTPARIIEKMGPAIRHSEKTVAALIMTDRDTDAGLPIFRALSVPVYSFSNEVSMMLAHMNKYCEIRDNFKNKPEVNLPIVRPTDTHNKQRYQLSIKAAFDIFAKYDLPLAGFCLSENLDEILDFASKTDGNVVLKIANEQIIHKSDAGLVKLNLSGPTEISESFGQIAKVAIKLLPDGIKPLLLAQEMVKGFPELVIGLNQDPQFGPVIMTGLGGILVEVLKDVSFRIAPLEESDAWDMLESLKSKKLMEGFRHYKPIDKQKIVDMIMKISQLAIENPEIVEMDLNPVIWSETLGGPVIVDARITAVK